MIVSICCNNASLASWKIRCASSMNITSLGLSRSPSSGQVAYNSASNCNMKVENSFGLSCRSVTRTIEIIPRPSSLIRIRSSTSKLFSPKKTSAPCCCSSITFRKIVPVEVVEIFPYVFSNSAFPSSLTYCNTLIKSFRSSKASLLSSQYLKIIATNPPCVSFNPKIFESNTGPNSLTVALNLAPF